MLDGRYRLLTRIGAGASASVYAAQDLALKRYVAVKVLHHGLAADPRFVRRFRDEATATAALAHPNLVAVHDAGQDGPVVYLVQELLTGGSLRDLTRGGASLTLSQAVLVGLSLGRGLDHAHRAGFVHRDIKPANVLFGSDARLRIADFGIARALLESERTETDAAVGTARYAAPEQGMPGPITPAADVYGAALTLIDGVAGIVPLEADSAVATLVARQGVDLPVPEGFGPLRPVLAAAVRSDPASRPTAAQFVEGLLSAASTLPRPAPLELPGLPRPSAADTAAIAQVPLTTAEREPGTLVLGAEEAPTIDLRSAPEPPARRRVWVGLLAALVVLAGVGAGVYVALRDSVELFGAEPTVPVIETDPVGDYVGLDIDQVIGEANARQWRVDQVAERRDGTVAGEVLQQSPTPGTGLAAGDSISVVVSQGPELRRMPVAVGVDRAVVEGRLTDAGLVVGAVTSRFDEVAASGVVLSAEFAAGAELESGASVDLTISDGPEPRVVPSVLDARTDDAIGQLEALGLTVTTIEASSDTVEEGRIISMAPAAGTTVARGDGVELTVSTGLPFVEVPDVIGQSAAAAADQLGAAGFVVVDTIGPPNGTVLATDPPAGEFLRKGTSIRIVTRVGAP